MVRQDEVLQVIRENPGISSHDLAGVLSTWDEYRKMNLHQVKTSTVEKAYKLRKKGLVDREIIKRQAHWRVVE